MKRCIYSNYIEIKNYRNKQLFSLYVDEIKQAQQSYANSIGVDYILFDKITETFNLPLYEQVNIAKYTHAKYLLQEYEEVLYLDFDIIPNTNDNFFEVFNLQNIIPIKATVNFDCYNLVEKYNNTIEDEKYIDILEKYHNGITDNDFHGIPWNKETRPGQFQEELGFKWFCEKNNYDIEPIYDPNRKIIFPSPKTIEPHHDIVKFAAVNMFTDTNCLYNTGVMGFSKNTFYQLDIIENIIQYKIELMNTDSTKWPSYITKHIEFNNEVLFSYSLFDNQKLVEHINDEWNYFVDWDSGIFDLKQTSSFEDCKFRHYLNKNFEKQWQT